MEPREFVHLVNQMLEAMDQHLAAARPARDGLLVRTTDAFLFVFVPQPERMTAGSIRQWLASAESGPGRLVVLTPGTLTESVRAELARDGGTAIEGPQFANLVQQLGIDSPIAAPGRVESRAEAHHLPTALRLSEIMGRADGWADSGVPALALRFYRQAVGLKPEYLPARIGVARALASLGAWEEAEAAWQDVLELHPGDVEGRLGHAAALGAGGRTEEEISAYRTVLDEHPGSTAARAGLLGALIETEDWPGACIEAETMIRAAPSDPHLRFLYGVTLERSGDPEGAAIEFASARALGILPGDEAATRERIEGSIRERRSRTAPPPRPDAGPPPLAARPRRPPSKRRPAGRKPKLPTST